jgi:hypothetical protein
MLAALFDDAMADTAPLFGTISRLLDERMLGAIAEEYRRGRLLFVATTNLDSATPVVWNIGAIAASGHPRAPDTIRRILLASAAIPGAFPPVLFDVELDGRRHQELHVDGGAIAQAFLYPEAMGADRRARIRARRPVAPIRAWVIRNGRMDAAWATTDRRTLTIAQRAVATMIAAGGYHDAIRIWLTAERDGVEFRLAWGRARLRRALIRALRIRLHAGALRLRPAPDAGGHRLAARAAAGLTARRRVPAGCHGLRQGRGHGRPVEAAAARPA